MRMDIFRAEEHRPVLMREVVEILQPAPGKCLVDGTFGRGGHTVEFLKRGASVLALDRDSAAILAAEVLKKEWGEKLKIKKTDFRNLEEPVELLGEKADGVLLDLGVSSPQLESAERGFSFHRDGPLDMRMDRETKTTAAMIVNERGEEELAKIFREYGEEKQSRRIARAIIRARPLRTTLELADVVARVLGAPRRGKTHPATRVFQALRIAVNDELGALRCALEAACRVLKIGGRLAVISFHSLEDRMVKQFIHQRSQRELRQEGMAFGFANPDYCLCKLGDWKPSEEEIAANPRARSARLRAAERVAYVA
ncbi:MAG: 16S rRNA (cytosine(1402)-N(4))-methyltransferase RsmH [bacterium]